MSPPNAKSPAMVLHEFTVKHRYPPPEYKLVVSKTGTDENEFYYELNVANVSAMGFGRSKQEAKQNVATKVLEQLANEGLYDPRSNPAQEFNALFDSPLTPVVHFVQALEDLCGEYKLPYPVFNEISVVGPSHCREFTYECKIASITTQATASKKRQAKRLAAKDMLYKIKDICPALADSNALTDKDCEAVNKYNELASTLDIMSNRTVNIDDFSNTLKTIMARKNLSVEDFKEQFDKKDKDGLQYIFDLLDVKYKIDIFQENPPIGCALFGLDTPFTVMELGNSKENAEVNVINEIYMMLAVYLDVPYLDNNISTNRCPIY
ncbi:hypothetical protein Zmor_020133 [Zophobas morio]|uniref:DRBM domain-containing protein n=1 Tax=Zophobas morio TaxID=2755281 RepID=A0AA38MA15_9CUCU|nr:hypothetical protein Zmor_020133 [Zophobas morio]